VILTGFGRALSLTTRIAGRLPELPPILELDVTNQSHLDGLADEIRKHVPHLDGVVHSIGFAPEAALGGNFLNTAWADVATAVEVSAYSLKSLSLACRPTFTGGASIVGLDFDASVAWPKYDWMGVAKAALESTSRYLARDLGSENIRVNLVAAGPIRTMAAKSIPGFDEFEKVWNDRSPLDWDVNDPQPAAKAVVALLSDWFPKTTGEIVHVDGGLHAMGA
jgi:enoyl-[acyl-carrier protein] reductase I